MPVNTQSIISKMKAIHSTRLTEQDYGTLINRKNASSIVRYLKTTKRYGSMFAGVTENQIHRGQIEFLLSKYVFESYIKLWKFAEAPRNSFLFYYIKKMEVELLVHAVFLMNSDNPSEFVTSVPTYFNEYCTYDLMEVASAKTNEDLLKILKNTEYYGVLQPLFQKKENRRVEFEECGRLLYGYYYRWIAKIASKEFKGSRFREFQDTVYFHLDLQNIIVAYRMKHYFDAPSTEIKNHMFFDYNSALRRRLDAAIDNQDSEFAITDIIKNRLSRDTQGLDWTNPEVAIRKHELRRFTHQFYHSDNYGIVLYSLMSMLEEERRNLITIIEGVRYQMDSSTIEKGLTMKVTHP